MSHAGSVTRRAVLGATIATASESTVGPFLIPCGAPRGGVSVGVGASPYTPPMDYLRSPIFLAAIVASLIAAGLLSAFAFQSSAKPVLFGLATVISSVVFFWLTVYVELRPPQAERASFPARFIVAPDAPAVILPAKGDMRPTSGAADWLRKHDPAAFTRDEKLLVSDLVAHEMCTYLFAWLIDWKARRFTFENSLGPQTITPRPRAKAPDSDTIAKASVAELLSNTGTLFARAPIPGVPQSLLPHDSVVSVDRRAVTVSTPFCRVRFHWGDDPEVIESAEAKEPRFIGPLPSPAGPLAELPPDILSEIYDHQLVMSRLSSSRHSTYAVH